MRHAIIEAEGLGARPQQCDPRQDEQDRAEDEKPEGQLLGNPQWRLRLRGFEGGVAIAAERRQRPAF